MGDPTPERLAEILWTGRKRSLGDDDADQPFGNVSSRLRTQYERFAAEVAKLLGEDRDAEVEQLRKELDLAMGPRMYLDVQKVLDGALGTRPGDGAGAGLVADVALVADRMKVAEAERDRIAEVREAAVREAKREREAHDQTAAELTQARTALEGAQGMALAMEAERDRLRTEGTFMTEVMAGTVLLGSDDAIGMLRALTEHLGGADVIGADQVEQVNAGLAKQQAERDEAREQVKRVREQAAQLREREANLKLRHDEATNDAQATALLCSAALIGDAAQRIERALDASGAGQPRSGLDDEEIGLTAAVCDVLGEVEEGTMTADAGIAALREFIAGRQDDEGEDGA